MAYRYAEGKWNIKEILVHLIDDERIYTYRAMRYARNNETLLPGFDEKSFVHYSEASSRTLESIFDEYDKVRQSTISLFQYLPEDSLWRKGATLVAGSEMKNFRTVRALLYHIAGHELHHIKIIKERYILN